ncbi:hypothetical protein IFR05_011217 [Cadophora sp. M221]|nr:hypothetical protein IFR05_011217 [Cadophora sp. M221]
MTGNSSDLNDEIPGLKIRKFASPPPQPQNTPVDSSSIAPGSPPNLAPYLPVPPLYSPIQTSETENPYPKIPKQKVEKAPRKPDPLELSPILESESSTLVPSTPSPISTPPPSILTQPSRSVLSLISIQSRDAVRRTEILLPATYYWFYWTCCQVKQKGWFFTVVTKTRCSSQNKLLEMHCRKCAHRQCSNCEKFARNSKGAVANGNGTINDNGDGFMEGQADMTRRLIGAYLMDWEENGQVVGLGKP